MLWPPLLLQLLLHDLAYHADLQLFLQGMGDAQPLCVAHYFASCVPDDLHARMRGPNGPGKLRAVHDRCSQVGDQ
jgi:hypothetical protein